MRKAENTDHLKGPKPRTKRKGSVQRPLPDCVPAKEKNPDEDIPEEEETISEEHPVSLEQDANQEIDPNQEIDHNQEEFYSFA
jgi:hypothetical protein